MTDFVISEEKLSAITMVLKQCGVPTERNVLLTEIRSRTLEEELKKERKRINDELDYIRHVESKDEFFVTVYLMDVRKIVRGKP